MTSLGIFMQAYEQDQFPQEIAPREVERWRAMRERDVPALEAILHDSLIFVHSAGRRDDKATLIGGIASGMVRYGDFAHSQLRCARLCPHTWLISGRLQAEALVADRSVRIDAVFTAVWVLDQGWKMVSWQSTPWPPTR
jgi:hypothetical protein